MNKLGKKRLLNVAKALRESPKPKKFNMHWYGHPCGTPSCALGHYAFRRDLQRTFRLSTSGSLLLNNKAEIDSWEEDGLYKHFGINGGEANELFETGGCAYAKTNIQAAKYIEKFVVRHSVSEGRAGNE